MEIKKLIHKKIKIIRYYNDYNYFPMYEDLINNNQEDDNLTFYELIKNSFLKFLNDNNLYFNIDNFEIFKIINMEYLEEKFKRVKIDYKYINLIKEQIFNGV